MKTKIVFAVAVAGSLLLALPLYGAEAVTYYPLKEGLKWEYSFSSEKRQKTKIIITNLPSREISDVKVTPRKWVMEGKTRYDFMGADDRGVYRYAEQKGDSGQPVVLQPKEYYLKNPVDQGTTWDLSAPVGNLKVNVNLTIESVGDTVTVPAGTFRDCVKIRQTGSSPPEGAAASVEAYEWYAPNVGPVKSLVTIKKMEKNQPPVAEHLTYQLESFRP